VVDYDSVYKFTNGAWSRFFDERLQVDFSAVAPTSESGLWVGYDGGAARLLNGSWALFTAVDGLVHPQVNDIYIGPDGVVWFASQTGAARYVP
jgi:hypothetical protein